MIPSAPKQVVKTLRLGMIPYWNLLPLRQEIARQQFSNIVVQPGHPSAVNQWLEQAKIDLAPCSSICLLNKPDFEMALPLGIASNGPVKSVYIGFHSEHKAILEHIQNTKNEITQIFAQAQAKHGYDSRGVAKYFWSMVPEWASFADANAPGLKISQSSASGATLSKCLYRIWFGKEAFRNLIDRPFQESFRKDRPIELVIGDEALVRRRQFHAIIDLGAFWKDITQLPFVFAVWQSRGACLNGWRRKIQAAGELAESKMKVNPATYLPDTIPTDDQGKVISLADYWKCINYRLGANEFRGLLTFLCLIRKLQEIPFDEVLMAKIMRWQDISQTGRIPTV